MLIRKMHQRLFDMIKAASFVVFVLYSRFVYSADTVPDLAQMIRNFSLSNPQLLALVTAFAYVMGMFFMIKGILELRNLGEARTAGSREHGLTGPLIYLGVGTILFYLPSSIQVGLGTFWTSWSPLSYLPEGSENDPWAELTNAILVVIQLVGVIAFIRGLVILTHISSGGQPGTFGRALTHIIGGLLCINMQGFVAAVLKTLTLGKS